MDEARYETGIFRRRDSSAGAFDVLEAAGIDAVSAGRVFDELAALKIVHGNTLRRVRRLFSVDAQQEHS